MADNTTNLNKRVIIGGSEHLRDSDFAEALCEGVIYVGDALAKGTAETQVVAATETGLNFKGIAINEVIRPGDTATESTVITPGKMLRYLKPTGGRARVRAMAMGYTTGATIPSGNNVYYNGIGSTIGANDSQLGDFYVDPAQVGDNSSKIGVLSAPVVAPDATTNSENAEMEMWY